MKRLLLGLYGRVVRWWARSWHRAWRGSCLRGVRLVFGVGVVSWGWGLFLDFGSYYGVVVVVVLGLGCYLGWFFYLLAGSGLVGCSLPAVGGTPGERGSESQKKRLNWEE